MTGIDLLLIKSHCFMSNRNFGLSIFLLGMQFFVLPKCPIFVIGRYTFHKNDVIIPFGSFRLTNFEQFYLVNCGLTGDFSLTFLMGCAHTLPHIFHFCHQNMIHPTFSTISSFFVPFFVSVVHRIIIIPNQSHAARKKSIIRMYNVT